MSEELTDPLQGLDEVVLTQDDVVRLLAVLNRAGVVHDDEHALLRARVLNTVGDGYELTDFSAELEALEPAANAKTRPAFDRVAAELRSPGRVGVIRANV